MAAELTGTDEAGEILEGLNRSNYFVTRHGHSEELYELHPMFRHFLLHTLNRATPAEALPDLKRRAGGVLESHGQTEAAVDPVPMSSFGQVGDTFFGDRQVFEADTSTEPPTAVGPALGRSLIECRVIGPATMSAPLGVLCQGSIAFDGRGFVSASGPIDLTAPKNSGAITGRETSPACPASSSRGG